MKENIGNILPEDFKRLHFVKLEKSNKDASKYFLKNHFNSTLLQVDGKYGEEGSDTWLEMEFNQPDSGKGRRKIEKSTAALFRASMKKLNSHHIYQNNASCPIMVCDIHFNNGEDLISISFVKDKSSSIYEYKAVGSEKIDSLHINRKQMEKGQIEISINAKTEISEKHIGRINFTEGKNACLSMLPELDMTMKAKLISILMFATVAENEIVTTYLL